MRDAVYLYELGQNNAGGVSQQDLEYALSVMWNKVRQVDLRISEHLRSQCPPPIFAIDTDFDETEKVFAQRYHSDNPSYAFHNYYNAKYWRPDLVEGVFASFSGFTYPEVCSALFSGMDPHEFSRYRHLPLHAAVTWGNIDGVRLLILAGVDVNKPYRDLPADTVIQTVPVPNHPFFGSYNLYLTHDGYATNDTSHRLGGLRDGMTPLDYLQSRFSSRDEAAEIAQIMVNNGARCDQQHDSMTLCNLSPAANYEKFVPEKPEEGALPGVTIPMVATWYNGPIFSITAETEYADVDFSIGTSSDILTVAHAGTYTEHSGWRNTGRLRINHSDDTKVGVLKTTRPLSIFKEEYVVTVTAAFFYHVNELNTVAVTLTVKMLQTPPTRKVNIMSGYTGEVFNFGAAGYQKGAFVGAAFRRIGDDAGIDIMPGGVVTISAALATGNHAITVEASGGPSAMFLGTMTMTLSVTQLDSPAPRQLYAIPAYSGKMLDFGSAEYEDGVFAGASFQRIGATRLNLTPQGAVNISSPLPSGIYTVTASATGGPNFLGVALMILTVKVVDPIADTVKIVEDGQTGVLEFQLDGYPDDMSYEKTHGGPALNINDSGQFLLADALKPAKSAVISVKASSRLMKGELLFEYTAKNPQLNDQAGLPDDCYRDPSLPKDNRRTERLRRQIQSTSPNYSRICTLITRGADVNDIPSGELPLLHVAISMRALKSQRILLANGAQVDTVDSNLGHPIHAAARFADSPMLKFLLDMRVDVNRRHGAKSTAPIHKLGLRSYYEDGESKETAKMLVNNGALVNAVDSDNFTYLHFVADNGDSRSMEPIMDGGPNPNLKTAGAGRLPLAIAVERGKERVVDILLKYAKRGIINLNLDATETQRGYGAIHYVEDEDMLNKLVCAGASVALKTNYQSVPESEQDTLRDIASDNNLGSDLIRAIDYWSGKSDAAIKSDSRCGG